MKGPSPKVTAVIFLILVALVGVTLYEQYTAPGPTGPWRQTTSYPLAANGTPGVAGQPCLEFNDTVYCIGGQDVLDGPHDEIYSAPLSSSGLGNWTSAGTYPTNVMFQSCVSYGGFAYCLGGSYDSDADDIALSYYAPFTSAGLTSWKPSTSYPVPADSQACVASSGYIYCVGGENETAGTNATAFFTTSSWFAPLTSSGVGAWKQTTSYPSKIFFPSCATLAGYIYCVGGEDSAGNPQNAAYSAALSPNGIGPWTTMTAYPFQGAGQDCLTYSSFLYCIGGWSGGSSYSGAVYYAALSPSGIGSWIQAGSYPLGLTTSCVVDPAGYVYCVGGYEGSSGQVAASYFGLLSPQPTATASDDSA